MRLVWQHLKNEWLSTAIWAAALGSMHFGMLLMWESIRKTGMVGEFEQIVARMPEAMRSMYVASGSMTTLAGWLQGLHFGGWIHILYMVYVALFVTGILIRDMDRRTIEFLLSLPVTRAQVLVARWVALTISLAAIQIVHVISISAGVSAIGETPQIGAYGLAAFNAFLLYLAMGTILLAVSTLIDDYGRGVGVLVGLGVGSYAVYSMTADLGGAASWLRDLLPFSLYDVGGILGQSEIPWMEMASLGAISALFLGLALVLFQRKQISI